MVKFLQVFTLSLLIAASASSAYGLNLDDFTQNGEAEAIGIGNSASVAVSSQGCFGGARTLRASVTSGLRVSVSSLAGFLSYSQDAGTVGSGEIHWDGDTNAAVFNPQGLGGINLIEDGSSAFLLTMVDLDPPATLIMTVYDASDPLRFSRATVALNALVSPVEIQFANFLPEGPNGAANFANVGALRLVVQENADEPDFVAEGFFTNGDCDEIPVGGESVYDECGVCGGDNSSCAGCDGVPNSGLVFDECGVCGGNNSSCSGCDGNPNSGLVFDVCGVCAGDGTSCLGCDGVPNSGKVVDQCGVCDGDGTSCFNCKEDDQFDDLAALDNSAKVMEKIINNIHKRVLVLDNSPATKAYVLETNELVHELQIRNWVLSWTLPVKVIDCDANQFCFTASNLPILDEYRVHNLEMYNIGKKGLKKLKNLTGTLRGIEKKAQRNLDKQYRFGENLANEIPVTQDVCSF